MNEIQQQRIEEAAENLINCNLVDLSDLVNQYDLRRLLIEMGVKILQNQWISVDEGLSEKRQDVLVAVLDTKSNTYFLGFDNIDDDNGEFLRDKNGFAIENNSHKITHWMPIPQIEGGEK